MHLGMRRPCFSLLCLVSAAVATAGTARAQDELSPAELAAVKASEQARVATIDKVYGTVVAIYGKSRQGGGSGVLFSPDGYALTNFHVVNATGEEGWAGLADGKLYPWKLIGLDPGGDVAIIRLSGQERFPCAELGDSRTVRVGDWAMAMGNPFVLAEDQKPTVTLGIVSAVQRFQPGAGKNSLVYGNCIQVDSSINPGNSGGPLFSLQGKVLGINGRGSFEERGRVNVGVGYAISVEQIKNFLPDLLATKVAEHGTLDAVFGDRAAGVVCEQINLDSKIAKAGLQLGDRLISFDGQRIATSNQFLNLISTLPAHWPVEVVFEHEGEKKTARVRLEPLPYAQQKAAAEGPPKPTDKPKPEGPPKPEEKPKADEAKKPEEKPAAEAPQADETKKATDDKQPDDAKKPDDVKKPDEPKKPDEAKSPEQPPSDKKPPTKKPQPKVAKPNGPPPIEPGKIRNAQVNREFAERILREWVKTVTDKPENLAHVKGVRLTLDGSAPLSESAGSWEILISTDGKFLSRNLKSDSGESVGFDGETFWRVDAHGKFAEKKAAAAEDELAEFAPLVALIALYQPDPAQAFSNLELQGGDKAQGQRAFRLRGQLKSGPSVYLWFDATVDASGQFHSRLLKAASQDDNEPARFAVLFGQQREVGLLRMPRDWAIVSGLFETPAQQTSVSSGEVLESIPDDAFKKPADAAPKK